MDAAVTVAAAFLTEIAGKRRDSSMPRWGKWMEASLRRMGSLTVPAQILNSNHATLQMSCAPMARTTCCVDILQNAIPLVVGARLTIYSIILVEQKMLV